MSTVPPSVSTDISRTSAERFTDACAVMTAWLIVNFASLGWGRWFANVVNPRLKGRKVTISGYRYRVSMFPHGYNLEAVSWENMSEECRSVLKERPGVVT